MKMIRYIMGMVLCAILSYTMVSCNDDYYADGGVLETVGEYSGTTTAYLESKPRLFDSLTTLIRLCDLTAEVNAAGNTFFAVQNYSIFNYLKLTFPDPTKRPKSLNDLSQEELDKIKIILRGYIVPSQRIVRDQLSTSYIYHDTAVGKKARFNLVREDYLGNVNKGAAYIMFGLNTSSNPAQERYQSVKVVTTDVLTRTGVLHVVETDTHILGFN